MGSPFTVCIVPFIYYLIDKIGLHEEDIKPSTKVIGGICVTPIIILYLIAMDGLYLLNALILMPLILIVKILSFGHIDILPLRDKIEESYKFLFDMNNQDIAGFRRLRTVSQLTFESYM